MVRRRDTSPVGLKEPPQRQRQHQKESSRRSSLDLIRKQYNHQDQGMVEQSRHTPTTPAAEERSFKSESDRSFNSEPDKSFIGERSFIAELRASTFKTPARGRSFRSERETSDMDLDDEADEYRSMPGSRARDSMTLKSPVNRSDTSMNQDADLPLRISLGIHSSAPNRSPSVAKRSSDLMDTDRDRLVDAESKRSKSSPFLDTLVPIRFNSPEAESRTGSNSDILTREARAKFGDLSSTASASRSTGRSSAESASRLREPGVESSSAKKRVSDTNMERPIRSTTPTTTPHQRYGYGSAFTEGFAATSEEPTRSAVLRDGVQDGSANADVTRSSYDTAATLRDQVNGGSVEHRMNGVSSSSDSKMNRDSAAQKQAEHTNSHALAENQQDYPPWRQADRTDEEGSSVPANRPGRDEGEQSTRPKPITTTTTVRSEMTAFSSSFTGSSDAGTLRTKPSMTLPEKRTLGTRRPVGTSSNTLTSAFMPPSRLTKITTTNVKSVAGSSVESQVSATIQSDISSAIQTSSSNKITRAGGVQSTAKDAQQSGAEPNGTRPSTMATTSSTSTTGLLGRQGAPSRPPLTSNRVAAESSGVNGTNNGLSRTENQGSNSLRKPFAIPSSTVTAATTSTSKSVFALKKTTIRPVLPDGVPSTLLASSNSSASTRPPGSSLAMMQARIDQHTRESTPTHDAHSKSTRSTTELKTTTTGSSTLSLSSVISSRKESMSTAGNGVRAETQSSSRAAVTTDGGHVFAVPAPVQQPLIPPWDSNFAQPERRHVKTILPEINSDGEDHDPNNPDDPSTSRAKRKKTGVPEWASWEELHRMMESQKNLNPEEIFGPIPMLDVAEIFPGGQKKSSYRPRTSSAHWGASDALTPQEVIKYNEDMGWGSQE
ncbi:hypothetical protein EC991_004622 [Linnemannia zychae]|nr:hypothetical protein EC991_004622 [Linnemannia zychae]